MYWSEITNDQTHCRCVPDANDEPSYSLSARHGVFGLVFDDHGEIERNAGDGSWILPEGEFTMNLVSTAPRAFATFIDHNGEIWDREFDWEESFLSDDLIYELFRFDGRYFFMIHGSISTFARDFVTNFFVSELALHVQLPDIRVTHPLYGEVEFIDDSPSGGLIATMRESHE